MSFTTDPNPSTVRFVANQYWINQGAYSSEPIPHRIYPTEPSQFYSVTPIGSVTPNVQNWSGSYLWQRPVESYPWGPVFPNAAAYFASVPGKVDLSFAYRPFF